jgi:hypothetical protein
MRGDQAAPAMTLRHPALINYSLFPEDAGHWMLEANRLLICCAKSAA